MLITSPRHTPADLEQWAIWERTDEAYAARWNDRKMVRSMDEIAKFASLGRCYAGVSWGKDSTVLAHLVLELAQERGVVVPLVWVRVKHFENPDCLLVRDSFFANRSHPYEEIEVSTTLATGRLEAGFEIASDKYGARHVSGVRGAESTVRAIRMARWGVSTERTCAPIGWWSGQDVFTYLHVFGLPVHPAYACSMGGVYDRERLRVASLGGSRGNGMGRSQLEDKYYREEMRTIRRLEAK